MGDKLSFVSENLCVGSEDKGFLPIRLRASWEVGEVISMEGEDYLMRVFFFNF